MQTSSQPKLLPIPFANAGSKQDIPNDSQVGIVAGRASYSDGFPPLTRTPLAAGGVPPFGTDFNGVLNDITSALRWSQAGAGYPFNAAFNTAVSGYPKGARIPNSTLDGFWLNTTDGNSANPENATSALTGWVPLGVYGATAITGLAGSSVTLTTLQASRDRITLSGTLTANINLVVPAWIKRWEIVNNCAGAFSVTIKTPTGTGVTVASGATAIVQGDGANIVRATAPGTLVNTQYLTSTGTYIKTPGTKNVRVRGVGGGGAGGGVGATSSGSVRAGGGGASGTYGEIWIPNVPDTVPYTIGSAGNGVLGGDGGNGGSSTFGSYLTLPGGGGGQLGITVTGPARTAGGGSAAGVAVGASYSVQGQRGSDAFAVSNATVMAGSGSGNPLGTGASLFIASTSASVSSQGVSGSGSGSGGGGAVSGNGGTAQAGGPATAGAFIVEEFA